MEQPLAVFKSVVRIVDSDIIMYSDDSCEIHMNVEALDYLGNVIQLGVYDHAKRIDVAWEKVRELRPRSTHYAEGNISFDNWSYTLWVPFFSPYNDNTEERGGFFTPNGSRCNTPTPPSHGFKTVSGSIKNVRIITTEGERNIAIFTLVERDDYSLVVFPHLWEAHMSMILSGAYLEYCGIPQRGYPSGEDWCSCDTMIFVNRILNPNSQDEQENTDHE